MTSPSGSRMVDCTVPVMACPESSRRRCWSRKDVPSMIETGTEMSVPCGMLVVVAVTMPALITACTLAMSLSSFSVSPW